MPRAPLSSCPVCERLRDTMQTKLNITTLTRIQSEAIPVLLDGRDAMLQSQTGSGKTLAFLVPVLQKLQEHEQRVARADGTRAIIILPTRELCVQVLEVLQKVVTPFHWLVTGSLMGGEKKKAEKARLRKGVPLVVATPGRLVDHLKNTECFEYKRLEWLVLDEADRLLDLGFEKDLAFIVHKLRAVRRRPLPARPPVATGAHAASLAAQSTRGFQTVLASATLTEGVERLARLSLNDPAHVGYDGQEEADEAPAQELVPATLSQSYMSVDSRNRLSTLAAVLRCKLVCERRKVLVFLSTCDSVDFHHEVFKTSSVPFELGGKNSLAEELAKATGAGGAFGGGGKKGKKAKAKQQKGKGKGQGSGSDGGGEGGEDLIVGSSDAVFKLHGNMPQAERTRSFGNFSKRRAGVLFCTDVAARGLDIAGVDWIIQYDPPNEAADYIHRVGRTARAGRGGEALLFLQQSEEAFCELLELKGLRLGRMHAADFFLTAFPPSGARPADPRLIESAVQRGFEAKMLQDDELSHLAAGAWQAFLRAYQTHSKETRKAFQVKRLHLGHVAKSFGLKETPTRVANKAKERASGHRGGDGAMTWKEEGLGLDKKIGKQGKQFKKSLQAAKRKVRAEGHGVVQDGKLIDAPRRRKRPRIGITTTVIDASSEFGA